MKCHAFSRLSTPTQYIGDNATFLKDALEDVLAFLETQRGLLQRLHSGAAPLGASFQEEATQGLARFQELDLDYLAGEIPRALQQSLDGVAQVTRIVGAMKDFSHPGEATQTPADLNRAIESTLSVSRNEWKYVAEMEVDLDPKLPPVPCFLGEFNQVMLNLVVNAAHAITASRCGLETGPLGRIRIVTRQVGEEVEVTVSDNGCGIPAAIHSRIFDPFFTTKPVGKGTGQGLAIVRGVVVDRHGGRVTVDSAVGEGSTFHLWLPLQAADGGESPHAGGERK